MIGKLDMTGRTIYENTAIAKLNEVIDAVNELQMKVGHMEDGVVCKVFDNTNSKTQRDLEIAVDVLKRLEKELYFNNAKQTGHIADSVMSIPSIALEQIKTALEQKDK